MEGRSAAIGLNPVVDAPFLQIRLNDGRIPQGFERHEHQVLGRRPLRVKERLVRMERDGFHCIGNTFFLVAREGYPARQDDFPSIHRLAAVGKSIAFDFPAAFGEPFVQSTPMMTHLGLQERLEARHGYRLDTLKQSRERGRPQGVHKFIGGIMFLPQNIHQALPGEFPLSFCPHDMRC